jgi:mono/diheme cytochrome c family protein
MLVAGLTSAAAVPVASAAERDGQAIYKQECASCHGAAGQGTKRARQPLVGDRSLAQLARVIRETMPEDDPGHLVARGRPEGRRLRVRRVLLAGRAAKIDPPRVDLAR